MMDRPSYDSSRVISFVLMIAFGLLATVVGYATLRGGAFDLRSRASMDEKRSGSWDFSKNAEGWGRLISVPPG